MRHYFLCVESDTLAEASRHHTKREALAAYLEGLSTRAMLLRFARDFRKRPILAQTSAARQR